jgi:low temperature requirement protein LtrA
MGLFTLILLGEFVASVMRGMERQESWPPLAVGAAFLSLGLAVAIWSAYFDVVRAADERPIETAAELRGFWIWCNAHFGLSFAIVVVGVGLEHAVSELPGGSLHGEQLAIFAIALALLAVMLATLGFSRYRRRKPAALVLRASTESRA